MVENVVLLEQGVAGMVEAVFFLEQGVAGVGGGFFCSGSS